MHIEAVSVCVDYSDFLRHTIEPNFSQLDDWVVVTSYDDKKTQNLCREYGVRTVATDVFTDRGDPFNKARGINLGLAHLKQREWVLHLDGDIILPRRFRHLLDRAHLDKDCLYGADRVNCRSYDQWQQTQSAALHQYRRHYLLTTPGTMSLGARLVHNEYGYCPIGYFQLWNAEVDSPIYPTNRGSAEHTDVLFALRWPLSRRRLLPNVIVYHLETCERLGVNWQGRKSPRFQKRYKLANDDKNGYRPF